MKPPGNDLRRGLAMDAVRPTSRSVTVAVAVLALVLAGTGIVLGLSAPHEGQRMYVVRVVAEAFVVLVPVAVGLYAMRREQAERFSRLLVLAALALAPNMLALSSDSIPYSIGRAWAWGAVIWVAYLLLAFPIGRLTTRLERLIIGSGLLVVATLALPTLLFAQFPVPSPWAGCGTACPPNAFAIVHTQPAAIDAIVKIRDDLSIVLYVCAAFAVVRRWRRRSRTFQGVDAPVL